MNSNKEDGAKAIVGMSVQVATNDPNVDPLGVLKRVYPEVVELAEILRHYLIDANGQWQGCKLWMAVDVAQGAFDKEKESR